MALKDWKKKKTFSDGSILWETIKGDKFGNKDEVMIYKRPLRQEYQFLTDNPKQKERIFKTKSSALKFAKAYMRSH